MQKFCRIKFLLYLCTRNPIEILIATSKTSCGNSSVGRAQPCQGWGREFESRFPLQKPEKVEKTSRPFSFLPFGICYLSPKPPFCKGGLWSEEAVQKGCFFCLKRDSHEATPLAPSRGWGCKYRSREIAHEQRGFRVSFSGPGNQAVTEM